MTGLVGWWPLSSTTGPATDLSGEGNDGTLNGGPTRGVWGRGGLQAFSFDGTDDFVNLGGLEIYNLPTYSFCGWFHRSSNATGTSFGFMDAGFITTLAYAYQSTGWEYNVFDIDGTHHTAASGKQTNDEWVFLVGTYDGSEMELFYGDESTNISSVATANPNGHDSNTRNTYIGGGDDGSGGVSNAFLGNITGIRIYDRVLSGAEIQTLYEWGSGDYTDTTLHNGDDSGAVSRWEFEGDVTDSWGGNDGTDNTSAGFNANGIRGQAKSFDGTDDYITVASQIFDGLSEFTMTLWVNGNSFTAGDTIGLSGADDTAAPSERWQPFVRGTGELDGIIIAGGTEYSLTEDGAQMSTNEWHHACYVYNGSEVIRYINGTQTGTKDSVSGTVNGAFNPAIGARNNNAGGTDNHFDGQYDDLRLYNRALSDTEIHQLYRWGSRGIDMRQKLVIA